MIERHLDFRKDWQHGNDSFVEGRLDAEGQVNQDQYTSTRHIANIWTIGPAILWAPFLVLAHLGVLLCNRLGGQIPPDGFSSPYLITMACATTLYGFLGLWISCSLARQYFRERSGFLATLGIWWASSLPVYMYFNPSWSHAHSCFVVALFLWYWNKTRGERTIVQWIVLGLMSGLMVDVYYPNGVLLLVPLLEGIGHYWHYWKSSDNRGADIPRLLVRHLLYVAIFIVGLLPILISRQIIFGGPLRTGYPSAGSWSWHSPALWSVLFSSDHGMLSWTPILALALVGLVFFRRVDRSFANYLIVATATYYLVILSTPIGTGCHRSGTGSLSRSPRYLFSALPPFLIGLRTNGTSLRPPRSPTVLLDYSSYGIWV